VRVAYAEESLTAFAVRAAQEGRRIAGLFVARHRVIWSVGVLAKYAVLPRERRLKVRPGASG
jgi:hypothetical protein